jgi:hypothetical protein
VQLLRVVLILLAAAGAAGQYVQERYRLTVVERLPGREARAYYEGRRRRSHRVMMVVTVVAAAGGLAAIGDMLLGGH